MKRTAGVFILALLAVLIAGDRPMVAQARPSDTGALRANIERRFDILPLRDGVVLRPKNASEGIRSIEITDGPIAVDGQPVTGAELRSRLGDDADLVLALSYLDREERRTLFSEAAPPSVDDTPPTERRDRERSARRNRGSHDNDVVRIGGSVSVDEHEVIDGGVVAVGGSAHVNGEVHGDVVAVGGSVTLGPHASVSDNVVVIGGVLRRDPGARVGGQIQEIGLGAFNFGNWRRPSNPLGMYWGPMFGTMLALIATLTRIAILCLLAALVLLIGRRYAEQAGGRAMSAPLKSGAIGFLTQLLFIPMLVIMILVLVMTIVGIPLLLLIPFLLLGLALIGLVGFTGVSHRLGTLLGAKLGWTTDDPYLMTILGILALMLPALLARIISLVGGFMFPMAFGLGLLGTLIEYMAWTVGFGAVVLVRFDRGARAEIPVAQE
jgi:hypothetical protein